MELVSFFGPVRIYLPWFMDAPRFFKDVMLEIINPPEDLKPGGDFKAVLSGCHGWAEQGHDRSLMEMLKLSSFSSQNDGATWDIRRLLKDTVRSGPGMKGEDLPLKDHLLLHLASQIERRQFEIIDMMNGMRERGVLLAAALDDTDNAKGIFTDTDDMTIAGITDNVNIRSLLDAWFGLFSGYIKENDLLITCSRGVMGYIESQWEDGKGSEKGTKAIRSISFNLPRPFSPGYREEDIMKIRELILGSGEDPEKSMDGLHKILGDFEKKPATGLSKDTLNISLRYFPHISCTWMTPCNKEIISQIAGKAVVLVE